MPPRAILRPDGIETNRPEWMFPLFVLQSQHGITASNPNALKSVVFCDAALETGRLPSVQNQLRPAAFGVG